MNAAIVDPLLVAKYNQPLPRYTSYPTVPNWHEGMDEDAWKDTFATRFSEENGANGISLYIHLPFCESLCTYCGCNTRISRSHRIGLHYVKSVLKEWERLSGYDFRVDFGEYAGLVNDCSNS